MPDVSQPIRLVLAQYLTGEVVNGELARVNFAGNYTSRLLRTERCESEECHVLELKAEERSVTYHRILLWVSKAELHSLPRPPSRLVEGGQLGASFMMRLGLGGKMSLR